MKNIKFSRFFIEIYEDFIEIYQKFIENYDDFIENSSKNTPTLKVLLKSLL